MSKPLLALPLLVLAMLLQACSLTSHPIQTGAPGRPATLAEAEAHLDQPGPIALETIASADWQVPLGGLLNLKDPAAKAASLQDHDEAIQVYAHVLRHPARGAYLVDTGVARALLERPDDYGVHRLMRSVMKFDGLKARRTTEDIVAELGPALRGVFFTHLHIDHITGMPAIPAEALLITGKGEARATAFDHVFVRGVTDRLFAGKNSLREWNFTGDPAVPLSSVIDIFGDGSAYALNVPGHTHGSTAYLLRTTKGPVLLAGDTCHTRWGWDHGVEPGSFTADQPQNRRSLDALKALAARHPGMQVRLGHQ